jgi:hypothetical protein
MHASHPHAHTCLASACACTPRICMRIRASHPLALTCTPRIGMHASHVYRIHASLVHLCAASLPRSSRTPRLTSQRRSLSSTTGRRSCSTSSRTLAPERTSSTCISRTRTSSFLCRRPAPHPRPLPRRALGPRRACTHPHAHARLASAHACTPRIRTRMHASHLHTHARLASARACTPRICTRMHASYPHAHARLAGILTRTPRSCHDKLESTI